MSQEREVSFPASSGNGRIFATIWEADAPKGIFQIVHGMAEHVARYRALAQFLNARGWIVAGDDHAGHGRSAAGRQGYFAKEDGWRYALEDVHALGDMLSAGFPGVPRVLFGHSMGAAMSEVYATLYRDMDALILCGSPWAPPYIKIAQKIARGEVRRTGGETPSERIDRLAFGAYNKKIPGARTRFDWLSRDADAVAAYMEDEWCGFTFTASGFLDLFTLLANVRRRDWAANVADVPILLLAGDADPVGNYARGVRALHRRLRRAGREAEITIYPGARHELIHEQNREEIFCRIATWCDAVCQGR